MTSSQKPSFAISHDACAEAHERVRRKPRSGEREGDQTIGGRSVALRGAGNVTEEMYGSGIDASRSATTAAVSAVSAEPCAHAQWQPAAPACQHAPSLSASEAVGACTATTSRTPTVAWAAASAFASDIHAVASMALANTRNMNSHADAAMRRRSRVINEGAAMSMRCGPYRLSLLLDNCVMPLRHSRFASAS
jgi:hypothetical protein